MVYHISFIFIVIIYYHVLWNGWNEATIERLVNLFRLSDIICFFLFFYCNIREQTNHDDDENVISLKHFNPLFVYKTKMRTTNLYLRNTWVLGMENIYWRWNDAKILLFECIIHVTFFIVIRSYDDGTEHFAYTLDKLMKFWRVWYCY